MVTPENSIVAGSSATCPETNRKPLALIPWEYGPMGFGPRLVRTTSFMVNSPFNVESKDSKRGGERENQRDLRPRLRTKPVLEWLRLASRLAMSFSAASLERP